MLCSLSELRSVSSQDFASPRMSKVKVIHKEKLSNLQQNISQGKGDAECQMMCEKLHVSIFHTEMASSE